MLWCDEWKLAALDNAAQRLSILISEERRRGSVYWQLFHRHNNVIQWEGKRYRKLTPNTYSSKRQWQYRMWRFVEAIIIDHQTLKHNVNQLVLFNTFLFPQTPLLWPLVTTIHYGPHQHAFIHSNIQTAGLPDSRNQYQCLKCVLRCFQSQDKKICRSSVTGFDSINLGISP